MKKPHNFRIELTNILKDRGIKQRDICDRTNVKPSELNALIKGKRRMSLKIALALDFLFIKTAVYWLTKQAEEDVFNAKSS